MIRPFIVADGRQFPAFRVATKLEDISDIDIRAPNFLAVRLARLKISKSERGISLPLYFPRRGSGAAVRLRWHGQRRRDAARAVAISMNIAFHCRGRV